MPGAAIQLNKKDSHYGGYYLFQTEAALTVPGNRASGNRSVLIKDHPPAFRSNTRRAASDRGWRKGGFICKGHFSKRKKEF